MWVHFILLTPCAKNTLHLDGCTLCTFFFHYSLVSGGLTQILGLRGTASHRFKSDNEGVIQVFIMTWSSHHNILFQNNIILTCYYVRLLNVFDFYPIKPVLSLNVLNCLIVGDYTNLPISKIPPITTLVKKINKPKASFAFPTIGIIPLVSEDVFYMW